MSIHLYPRLAYVNMCRIRMQDTRSQVDTNMSTLPTATSLPHPQPVATVGADNRRVSASQLPEPARTRFQTRAHAANPEPEVELLASKPNNATSTATPSQPNPASSQPECRSRLVRDSVLYRGTFVACARTISRHIICRPQTSSPSSLHPAVLVRSSFSHRLEVISNCVITGRRRFRVSEPSASAVYRAVGG